MSHRGTKAYSDERERLAKRRDRDRARRGRMAKGAWIKFTATGEGYAERGQWYMDEWGDIFCASMNHATIHGMAKVTILRRTESRGKP